MNINSPRRRKAISPVLATVILIAITLIAAIAIAGFVFGLFGSFTSSARVQAAVTSCTSNGAVNQVCIVNLTNTGSSNAALTGSGATGCSIQVAGVSSTGAATPSNANIPAGGVALAATCTVTGGSQQAHGSSVVGSFTLSNGAVVPFAGTWA